MIEVDIVGEGQTEQTFVTRVLAPSLAHRRIFVHPRLIPTSKKARGGALSRDRVVSYLRNTLLERTTVYVTTFFDLYRLRSDFPGVSDALSVADPLLRATRIEAGLESEVIAVAGCRPGRFFAHIQPYEFESLLFSDVSKFGEARPEWMSFLNLLERASFGVASPEHINDGDHTHPSARLGMLKPRYEKLDGSSVAERIGLDRIRMKCAHFAGWLTRLESLQPLGGGS